VVHWLHRGKDWAAVGAEDRNYFIALGEQVPEFGAQDEGLARLQLHAEQAGIRGDSGRAFGARTKDSERHGEILLSAGSPSKDNLWGVLLGRFLLGLTLGRLLDAGRLLLATQFAGSIIFFRGLLETLVDFLGALLGFSDSLLFGDQREAGDVGQQDDRHHGKHDEHPFDERLERVRRHGGVIKGRGWGIEDRVRRPQRGLNRGLC
jgi:hypothetical protein